MNSVFVYLGVFAVLIAAVFLLVKEKQAKRTLLILTGIVIALEVFVFNLGSFRLLFGGYESAEVELTGENVAVSGGSAETPLTSGANGETLQLEISGIDARVSTVWLELDHQAGADTDALAAVVRVAADVTDETQMAEYRYDNASAEMIAGNAHSHYLRLNQSGKVDRLRLRLSAAEGAVFAVRGVTLNKMITPYFSVLRSIMLVLAGYALVALFTLPKYLQTYNENKRPLRRAAFLMAAVFAFLGICVTLAASFDRHGAIVDGNGGQMTRELVDAFASGQVSLTDPVEEDLLSLNNPYDWSERREAGISYKWDHLLFDGKYYSYYGVAPVLLLFLPYHLITGGYFPALVAVVLFSVLGVLFLILFFLELADRFLGALPNNMLISALLTMLMSCAVWYCFSDTNFYEIAQSAGFMFVSAGAFFMLRANVLGAKPIRYRYVTLSTACLALAVLSRPTLALYSVAALVYLVFGFVKKWRALEAENFNKKGARVKRMLPYFFSAVTCFAVLGGGQMLYNYLRFGSFFDFGIQYSLTINDFTKSEFHLGFMLIGLYNFLFAVPQIDTAFPFIHSNFSTLGVNGYYFVANTNAVGLFFRALPMFSYAALPAAWKALNKKEKRGALLLLLPVCVVAPLVIICSIWESGYGVRYGADFNWELLLGAILIAFIIYTRVADKQVKAFLRGAFIVSGVSALFVNAALMYDYMHIEGTLFAVAKSFERLFMFWL